MRSATYYRVRTLVRFAFWTVMAVGIYYLATHINWVGDGWCWGTITECFFEEGK